MTQTIALHRLLKRKQITPMLTEFAKLMPQTRLAIIRADGTVFVSIGNWSADDLSTIMAMVNLIDKKGGTNLTQTSYTLHPLTLNNQLLGAIVAHGAINQIALQCLHHSLTLLLTQAQEKRDVASEALERYREINLLYQITEKVGSNLNPDHIPQLVLTEAAKVIQSDMGAILLPTYQGSNILEIKACFGYDNPQELLDGVTHYLLEQVYETGQPEIFTALSLASSPIDVMLCVPLKTRKEILGVITLGRKTRKVIFTANDEKLLVALASQTAIAIDTAWLHQQEIKRQRLDKELAVGQQIQLSLLPEHEPVIPGWQFAAIYQSAREVGGDFYDFFELPGSPKRLGMLIADVTGKGVPAALFMAFSRSIIRTTSMHGGNPADVLKQANRLIVQDNRSGIFLTAFYAIVTLETGQVAYASAGHNWPLYASAQHNYCQELSAGGFLLGALTDINIDEQTIELSNGDVLVFFTDGVPEAMNSDGEMFGEERLQAVVKDNVTQKANAILQAIVDQVKAFTGDIPQSDDFTLFVVKRAEA